MRTFRNSEYFVTEDGEIFKQNKKISQSKMSRGYLSVSLHLEKGQKGKTFYVHRIVAEVYIENLDQKPIVNHINGNKFDNKVSNLEWSTYQENSHHSVTVLRKEMGERHSRAKVPDRIVRYLKNCKKAQVLPNFERIANNYGVKTDHIKNIYNGHKRKLL